MESIHYAKINIIHNQYKLGVNELFISIFWGHFYFGPYIFILLLLIPKPISVYHISPVVSQLTEKSDVADGTIKIK